MRVLDELSGGDTITDATWQEQAQGHIDPASPLDRHARLAAVTVGLAYGYDPAMLHAQSTAHIAPGGLPDPWFRTRATVAYRYPLGDRSPELGPGPPFLVVVVPGRGSRPDRVALARLKLRSVRGRDVAYAVPVTFRELFYPRGTFLADPYNVLPVFDTWLQPSFAFGPQQLTEMATVVSYLRNAATYHTPLPSSDNPTQAEPDMDVA
jgi:hypothetical protein